ncbi:MAG: hypothetical protein JO139_05585 [Alphaproteobacteria bacterium]|nr:hypothetical protein [Alphaproteobacteria bacterium]
MDKASLRRECERRAACEAALIVLADYVRRYSFVSGAGDPTPAQAEQRKQKLETIAGEIAALADAIRHGTATYREFERLLGELHRLGFFPETPLVAAVARAFA